MRAIKNVTSSWNWPNLSASNCCTCPPTRPTSISSNACGNSSRRIVCTRPITTTLRSSNRPSHPVSLKLKPHTGPPSTPCFPTASRPLKNQKLCQGRVYLRIPGGSRSASLQVTSAPIDLADVTRDGYALVEREWKAGDVVRLALEMAVERLYAHPDVKADFGRVALMRGPLIYCLEGVDNPAPLHRMRLPVGADLTPRFADDRLGGIV